MADIQPTRRFASLTEIINAYYRNSSINLSREPITRAAEAVHCAWQTVLANAVLDGADGIRHDTAGLAHLMANYAWLEALPLIAGGYSVTGLAALRRSIEFCCLAAKISASEERANDWLNTTSDTKARARFHRQCRIPNAYNREQYRYLWPLIAFYDIASDCGVHANVQAVSGSFNGVNDGRIFFTHQRSQEDALVDLIDAIGLGFWEYSAMIQTLSPHIKEVESGEDSERAARAAVTELLEGFADYQKRTGKSPGDIAQAILTGNLEPWESRFREFVERFSPKPRKCPKCGHEI